MRRTVIINNEKLNTARKMRDGWLKAEEALMTAQEYKLGSRLLRRVDLKEIASRIKYYENEIDKLESGAVSNMRVQRVVSRDI